MPLIFRAGSIVPVEGWWVRWAGRPLATQDFGFVKESSALACLSGLSLIFFLPLPAPLPPSLILPRLLRAVVRLIQTSTACPTAAYRSSERRAGRWEERRKDVAGGGVLLCLGVSEQWWARQKETDGGAVMSALSDRFSQPRREQYISAAHSGTDSTAFTLKWAKECKGENAGAALDPGSPSALGRPIRRGPNCGATTSAANEFRVWPFYMILDWNGTKCVYDPPLTRILSFIQL